MHPPVREGLPTLQIMLPGPNICTCAVLELAEQICTDVCKCMCAYPGAHLLTIQAPDSLFKEGYCTG